MTTHALRGRALALAALVPLVVSAGSTAGAQTADPADVALDYLRANAAAFGLTDADVADVRVKDQVPSAHTGVTHVYLEQRQSGIPVANGIVNVNVAPTGTVLSAGNRFVADLAAATAGQDPARVAVPTAVQATAAAARHVGLTPTEPLVVVEREPGPARESTVSDGGIAQTDIPAELVWLPLESGGVRLAWTVEIEQTDGQHWWVVSIDSATGAVLRTDDRLVHDDVGALAGMLGREWTTGGNNLAIQLVVDGMKFQPCSPGFVDGRDAILAADRALTGGENQCAIWRAFTKRGLGAGASQGSSNNVLDGVASFDLPASCGPQFDGFRPPVNAPPAVTSRNAGSTVPVRFRLLENQGLGADGVAAFTQEIDCATHAPVGDITPARGQLSHVREQYHFQFRTDRAWEDTCRQLILRIQDVTDPVVWFRFD